MTQTLYILRGLPLTGKSNHAREWCAQEANRYRISGDELAILNFNAVYYNLSGENQAFIDKLVFSIVERHFNDGHSVVVDGMNLKAKSVRLLLQLANNSNVVVEHRDFLDELHVILKRLNPAQDLAITEEEVRDLWKRFVIRGKKLASFPRLEDQQENHNAAERYTAAPGTPDAFIVDIDGTLAKATHRSIHDLTRVITDDPHQPMIDLVQRLYATGANILITSGRQDSCREDTEEWLDKYDVPYTVLLMRDSKDERPDNLVKLDLFNEHIRHHYNVLGVFDDRDQVVEMWRGRADIESRTPTNGLGLFVAQVDYGNF